MWYTHLVLCFLAWMSMKWLQKVVPLSDSVLSGVLHHNKTYFSTLKVFWVVALVTGYDSNHIVVTSTTASLWCFHQHIHGSMIYLICQAFLFWYLNHCLMFSWAHQAMSNFPLRSQSRSTWSSSILAAWSTCCLFWCSAVVRFSGTWASVWQTFTTRLCTQAATSCWNTVA